MLNDFIKFQLYSMLHTNQTTVLISIPLYVFHTISVTPFNLIFPYFESVKITE